MARHLGKVFILSWTPDHFGERHKIDDLRHCHVLQRISPLRSGLQHLRAAGELARGTRRTPGRRRGGPP
ncbi:hypothetical protein M885DRAFT_510599 [Pelagophyceae sp. CCMP2097]|nr:hypothetical protein M885DRAFT_510599 [Pelagophyceae sp. CCMP2097]